MVVLPTCENFCTKKNSIVRLFKNKDFYFRTVIKQFKKILYKISQIGKNPNHTDQRRGNKHAIFTF